MSLFVRTFRCFRARSCRFLLRNLLSYFLTHKSCAALPKAVISEEHHQKDAALIPPVAMETAHFGEAVGGGVCFCADGCHGDGYGDLHKYSSGVGLGLMINSVRVGWSWNNVIEAHADEDIRVPPTLPSAKVRIVSLAIKRRLPVEQMPSSPKVTFPITQSFYPSCSLDE